MPVRLESRITELGVLELWGVSTVGDERWELEFSVREDVEKSAREPGLIHGPSAL